MSDDSRRISRRAAITTTAGAVGAALLARAGLAAQDAPVAPPDPTKLPGMPTSAVSGRSPFVHPERAPTGVLSGPSFTPLQELTGTSTSSAITAARRSSTRRSGSW